MYTRVPLSFLALLLNLCSTSPAMTNGMILVESFVCADMGGGSLGGGWAGEATPPNFWPRLVAKRLRYSNRTVIYSSRTVKSFISHC